jgi:hypothetical protein
MARSHTPHHEGSPSKPERATQGGDGAGFVNLSRSEYKVLKQLIGSNGDMNAAQDALRRDPSISESDWPTALQVFQHHKNYKDES